MYIGDILRMREVEKYFPPGSGECLDAGSGDNIYKNLVEGKGYWWHGIDLNPKPPAVSGDVTNIPFPDNHFEAGLCVDVLEHVPEDTKALKELHRVLKSDGQLILHTPNSEQTHILAQFPDNPDHVRKGYKDSELKNMLMEAGFSSEIHPTFNMLYCLAWELVNLKQIDGTVLERLINFEIENYKNLGWIIVCRKRL